MKGRNGAEMKGRNGAEMKRRNRAEMKGRNGREGGWAEKKGRSLAALTERGGCGASEGTERGTEVGGGAAVTLARECGIGRGRMGGEGRARREGGWRSKEGSSRGGKGSGGRETGVEGR